MDTPARNPAAIRGKARIDPLSTERYRVQLTAGVSLKQKLELSRDLMRHQNPSGDLAPIVEQALELLLERLMKQRFGRGVRVSKRVGLRACAGTTQTSATAPSAAAAPTTTEAARAGAMPEAVSPPARSGHVDNATRRAVSDRDGLRCTWVDASGERCASRAWLEFDHRVPRGKGGGSEAENVRLLCRAHNQLSAELHYGRTHVERAIGARKLKSAEPLVVRDVASCVGRSTHRLPPPLARSRIEARHPPAAVSTCG